MSRKATLRHIEDLGRPVVVVAVTDQASCDRLIREGARRAQAMGVGLKVVSIQPFAFHGLDLGLNLDYLYSVAKEHDAEMSVFYHDDALLMLGAYLQRCNTVQLVAGTAPGDDPEGAFIRELRKAFPRLPVSLVDPDALVYELTPLAYARKRRMPRLKPMGDAD